MATFNPLRLWFAMLLSPLGLFRGWTPRGREPEGKVAHVLLDVRQRPGFSLHPSAFRLGHEGGRPAAGVPVVVGEMMETRFGDAAPEKMTPFVLRALEGNDQIELTPGCLTRAARHDPRSS